LAVILYSSSIPQVVEESNVQASRWSNFSRPFPQRAHALHLWDHPHVTPLYRADRRCYNRAVPFAKLREALYNARG